jgi:hypothetical protein
MRQMIASGEEKDKVAMHFTVGVRRRDEAEAAALGKLGLKRACWCAAEAKGRAGA